MNNYFKEYKKLEAEYKKIRAQIQQNDILFFDLLDAGKNIEADELDAATKNLINEEGRINTRLIYLKGVLIYGPDAI